MEKAHGSIMQNNDSQQKFQPGHDTEASAAAAKPALQEADAGKVLQDPNTVSAFVNGSVPPEPNEASSGVKQRPLVDEAVVITKIRDLYKEILEEPVPDEFMKRMEELAKKERKV